MPLRVLLRNVSGRGRLLQYHDGFFVGNPPAVTDSQGRPATLSRFPRLGGLWRLLQRPLGADEVMVLGSARLELAPPGSKDSGRPTLYATPGKYRVRYTGLPPVGRTEPAGLLCTGQLELEVKEAR